MQVELILRFETPQREKKNSSSGNSIIHLRWWAWDVCRRFRVIRLFVATADSQSVFHGSWFKSNTQLNLSNRKNFDSSTFFSIECHAEFSPFVSVNRHQGDDMLKDHHSLWLRTGYIEGELNSVDENVHLLVWISSSEATNDGVRGWGGQKVRGRWGERLKGFEGAK